MQIHIYSNVIPIRPEIQNNMIHQTTADTSSSMHSTQGRNENINRNHKIEIIKSKKGFPRGSLPMNWGPILSIALDGYACHSVIPSDDDDDDDYVLYIQMAVS